ncbi:MAG: hypothetical protein GY884_23635 [Proteobacteria bacterium]|nr:hypothetical protein [Pseudomonadota bacterium]
MTMLFLSMLAACETAQDCPEVACPECVPPPANALEDWEAALLSEPLDDLRAGVRPYGEDSVGICQGDDKDCPDFIGLDAGTLAEGDHILMAELAVPAVGEGWQVRFEVACDVTLLNGKVSDVDHEKTYDVIHTGPNRGYRLSPLWRIQSPHPQGERRCTWALTPVRPDGVDGTPMHGAYTTQMPPTE